MRLEEALFRDFLEEGEIEIPTRFRPALFGSPNVICTVSLAAETSVGGLDPPSFL